MRGSARYAETEAPPPSGILRESSTLSVADGPPSRASYIQIDVRYSQTKLAAAFVSPEPE